MSQKLYHFLKTGLLILTLVILAGLTLSLFFTQSYVDMNVYETSTFMSQPWYFYPLVLLSLYILYLGYGLVKRFSFWQIFTFFAGLYLVLGLYLILNVEGELRADAGSVYSAALAIRNGDFLSFFSEGAYLYIYPFQLGLVTLDVLYTGFVQDPKLIFFINLLEVIAINFFISRLTQTLIKNEQITKFTLVLTFLFFPQFFFILFAYGITPGLLAILSGFYLLIKYQDSQNWQHLAFGALLLALATLIRSNYQIFIITLVILYFLYALLKKSWKQLLVPLVVVASVVGFSRLLNVYYSSYIERPIPDGIPLVSYVTMGLSETNETNPGWYSGYNTYILENNNYDQDKAKAVAKADLTQRLAALSQDPGYALSFFARKIRSTWLDSTFQSIWTGPLADAGQETYTASLKSLYGGGLLYNFFNLIGSLLLLLIYGLNSLYLACKLFKDKSFNSPFEFYPFIFFLGGFFFHLFWETKSQYVYVYVILLIPTAVRGLKYLADTIQAREELPEWTDLKVIIRRDVFKYRFIILNLMVFGLIFLLNQKTLYTSDDFRYSFFYDYDYEYPIISTHRLSGITEVIQSQINHYQVWNGRFVAHSFLQFFLQFPKPVINIFNSLVFVGLGQVISLAAQKLSQTRPSFKLHLLTFILMWWFLPNYGLTVFWLSGAFNYLWMGLIYTTFMTYSLQKLVNTPQQMLLMAGLGFLAGATNENSGPASLLFVGLILLGEFYFDKTIAWPKLISLGTGMLGFALMVLAPGSQARSGGLNLDWTAILANLSTISNDALGRFWPLYLLVAYLAYRLLSDKSLSFRELYFLASLALAHLASMLALVFLREIIEPRLYFGAGIFLVMLAISLLAKTYQTTMRLSLTSLIWPLVAVLGLHYLVIYEDLNQTYLQVKEQYRIIKTSTTDKVEVPFFDYPKTDYNAYNGTANLTEDPNQWFNQWMAEYFGKSSIKGIPRNPDQ